MLLQRPPPVYCGGPPRNADAASTSASELDAPPPDEQRSPVAMLDIMELGLAQRSQLSTSCTYATASGSYAVPHGAVSADPLLPLQDTYVDSNTSASSERSSTPRSGFMRRIRSWFARPSR